MMTSSTMFAQSSESVEAYILNMNLTNFKSNTTSNDYSFLGSNTTNKTIFLKEKITPLQGIGIFIVIVGVVMITWGKK